MTVLRSKEMTTQKKAGNDLRQRSSVADADILAIRHPYVQEDVGGRHDDWDSDRFSRWGLDLQANRICLIVEVKTGKIKPGALDTAFGRERLNYAFRRFGVLPTAQTTQTVDAMDNASVATVDSFSFGKLLISNSPRCSNENPQSQQYLYLNLREAVDFIRGRMRHYQREKSTARMFFASELIQFLAWESGSQCSSEIGFVPDSEDSNA